jgi:hypothetical protein
MKSLNHEVSTFDFETLPVETIILETAHVERAQQLARAIPRDSQQWQVYLNALALFAFEQWLQEWAADLPLASCGCSLFSPYYAQVLGAVCGVNVGEFRVCLVPMGSGTEGEIAVPRTAIAIPPLTAHFYVAIELFEEENAAVVWGFLRRDRLLSYLETTSFETDPDWTYPIPAAQWERNPEEVLLYLRCAQPLTIPLPSVVPSSLRELSALQVELVPLRSRFEASELELWEVLTWEQAEVLLSHPEMLQWFLNSTETTATLVSQGLQRIRQSLDSPRLNVGLWLRDRLDELAQEMAWVLLPAFSLEGSGLRSPAQELQGFIERLEREGCSVPSVARSAYLEFQLAQVPLKLYAIAWPWLAPDARPAWTLLLILGAPPDSGQLQGLKIAIADATALLLEKTFHSHSQRYLYARVGGTIEEEFSVTITTAAGISLTLPPFVFD